MRCLRLQARPCGNKAGGRQSVRCLVGKGNPCSLWSVHLGAKPSSELVELRALLFPSWFALCLG